MDIQCHLKWKHWQIKYLQKIQSLRSLLTNSTLFQGTAGELYRYLSRRRLLSKNIHLGTHYIFRIQTVKGKFV